MSTMRIKWYILLSRFQVLGHVIAQACHVQNYKVPWRKACEGIHMEKHVRTQTPKGSDAWRLM